MHTRYSALALGVRAGLLVLVGLPTTYGQVDSFLARPLVAASPPDTPAAATPAVRALYRKHCARCHGADGKGSAAKGLFAGIPDFTSSQWQARRSDAQFLASIQDGKGAGMPSLAGKITKSQASHLVKYVRTFAPAIEKTSYDRKTRLRNLSEVSTDSNDSSASPSSPRSRSSRPGQASVDSTPVGPTVKPQREEIREEAGTANPLEETSKESAPSESEDALPSRGFLEMLIGWLGRFHPATVHFPIAMLTAAAVAELLRRITGQAAFDAVTRFCLWFGALTAVAASVLGWFLGGFHLIDASWLLTAHRWLGTSTLVAAVLVLGLSEWRRRLDRHPPGIWFGMALLIVSGLVLATGFFGGRGGLWTRSLRLAAMTLYQHDTADTNGIDNNLILQK